ncbi:MAG: tRNA(Ile)(2)-agmatinylcytidine synthase [Methanimicrococcus sp.]|nr:tRNA(Ile)(2)-agmatinylcytidine synthase [Methanimicrococcus sp.]
MDDTDSNEGMCTAYLAALLADELKAYGTVTGFPYLIRLNPAIPYKTRGNAALGIDLRLFDESDLTLREQVVSHVTGRIQEYAETECDKTNPGAVFIYEEAYDKIKEPLCSFFKKAVTDVIEIEEAFALADAFTTADAFTPADAFKSAGKCAGKCAGLNYFTMKNGRGFIGALAVCGAILNPGWETTYEYAAYRRPENWGNRGGPSRFVDTESLIEADRQTAPETWDTIDFSKKTKPFPVCVPGANDPVLYGIRGNSPKAVKEAAGFVISEEIERFCVFLTNQGTDSHLILAKSCAEIKPLHSYIISGAVFSPAETLGGGHDIFSIKDAGGNVLECAAYEPTGRFRHIIRQLIPGDSVTVFGSFKNQTLNLEKIKINETVKAFQSENPVCPACGKRMESAGQNQGFRCKKCKEKAGEKIQTPAPRRLKPGYYEVPPSTRRHLSKPLIRYTEEEKKR